MSIKIKRQIDEYTKSWFSLTETSLYVIQQICVNKLSKDRKRFHFLKTSGLLEKQKLQMLLVCITANTQSTIKVTPLFLAT